jgi:hypothetical protein
MGGFALNANGINTSTPVETDISIAHSSFNANNLTYDNGSGGAAGGFAVNNSHTSKTMIEVSDSSFNNNIVTLEGGGISQGRSGGGFAVFQGSTEPGATMDIKINHSSFSDNVLNSTNSTISVGGGFAVFNDSTDTTTNIQVYYSKFYGNDVNFDTGQAAALGGFAVSNHGAMNVDVHHSLFADNNVNLTNFNNVSAAGGFAARTDGNEMEITLDHSSITNNTTNVVNTNPSKDSTVFAAGGLALYNERTDTMTETVKYSNISNNHVNTDGGTVNASGGVAFNDNRDESRVSPANVNISNSKILFNDTGIAVTSPQVDDVVTLNHSILAHNGIALFATGPGATIDVTNPIFFNGQVIFQDGAHINFPGLTNPPLVSGQNVLCTFMNINCVNTGP